MVTDRAARSDFLVHWTGRDIDEKYDPDWYNNPKSNVRRDTDVAAAYIDRLRGILRYGLWLTTEDKYNIGVGSSEFEVPSTPKVCFTELRLSESRFHAKRYGRLGIGFKRPYLFKRQGRPMAYFGYDAKTSNDPLLKACTKDLKDPNLLNYFKPMNSSINNLDYDYYSESEWRILYSNQLLEQKLIIDPQNEENLRAHEFYQGLDISSKISLKYLMPLDGWFAVIIYPSFWVKNMANQDPTNKIVNEIQRIKSARDHANNVEGGNWPMEIDLPACRHF